MVVRAVVVFAVVQMANIVVAAQSVAVGIPVSAVTVPLSEVTVTLESKTVSEESLRAEVSPLPVSLSERIKKVRSSEVPESERLEILSSINDQDAIFYLMIKPGSDTNIAVRIAAMRSIKEMDILRFMEMKCQDERIRYNASVKLSSVYPDKCPRTLEECAKTVRMYAKRMKNID